MRSPPRNGALVPLAAAGLALGVAALYLRLRVLDAATETIAAATGDLIALFYPLMRYGFSELAAGRLPLWNPYQSCGEPLLANPSIGFFYPLYLPFLWLDTARAIDLDVVIHLALSAVGTALLCRHLRMGWAAALLAGLVYAFHGSMLIKIPYPGFLAAVAWIPLIFLLVDRVCAHPTRRAAAGLGTVLGISLLGGNLQFTYFTAWALVPWLAARTWTLWRRGWPHVARAWGYLALAGALAIGLALVRLLPGAELMQLSWRAPGSLDLQHTAIMAIPPRLFAAGLVTPPAAVAANLIAAHFYADSYAGVLPLCLAIAGLVLWRQRAVAIALAAAGAAAALYAFGTAGPLFGWVFALPGGSLFRAPDRALIVFGFAVAVLSGAGLEALARGQTQPRGQTLAVATLAIAAVVALAFLTGDPAGRRTVLTHIALGAVAIGALVQWGAGRSGAVAAAAVAALIAFDLATAQRHAGMMPSRLGAHLSRNNDVFDAIRSRQGLDRTYIWASTDASGPLYFFSDVAEAGLYHGIWMTTSYAGGIAGRRLERYMSELGPRPFVPLGYLPFQLNAKNRPLFDLMGARFLLIEEGHEAKQFSPQVAATLSLLRRERRIALYENPQAMPRAFVAGEVRVVADEDALLEQLAKADLHNVAFVEHDTELPGGAAPDAGAAAPVNITRYEANSIVMDVDTPRRGLLVLTDQDYPGWRATVDGAPAPIHRADYLFRGIAVPAGRHRVELTFRPTSLMLGTAGSVIALLAIAWLGFKNSRSLDPEDANPEDRIFNHRGHRGHREEERNQEV